AALLERLGDGPLQRLERLPRRTRDGRDRRGAGRRDHGARRMRAGVAAAACALLLGGASVTAQPRPPAHVHSEAAAPEWEFSLSGVANFVPDDIDYGYGTFTADRSLLHLEARYNYESLHTGSAWIGANFEFGKTVTFEITPMLGGVFGDTNGIAPGYH